MSLDLSGESRRKVSNAGPACVASRRQPNHALASMPKLSRLKSSSHPHDPRDRIAADGRRPSKLALTRTGQDASRSVATSPARMGAPGQSRWANRRWKVTERTVECPRWKMAVVWFAPFVESPRNKERVEVRWRRRPAANPIAAATKAKEQPESSPVPLIHETSYTNRSGPTRSAMRPTKASALARSCLSSSEPGGVGQHQRALPAEAGTDVRRPDVRTVTLRDDSFPQPSG